MPPYWRKNGGIAATLNVKDFPDELYDALKERARRDHRAVTREVVHPLTAAVSEPEPLSLGELRGLGAELWRERDAATHIEAERSSWGS